MMKCVVTMNKKESPDNYYQLIDEISNQYGLTVTKNDVIKTMDSFGDNIIVKENLSDLLPLLPDIITYTIEKTKIDYSLGKENLDRLFSKEGDLSKNDSDEINCSILQESVVISQEKIAFTNLMKLMLNPLYNIDPYFLSNIETKPYAMEYKELQKKVIQFHDDITKLEKEKQSLKDSFIKIQSKLQEIERLLAEKEVRLSKVSEDMTYLLKEKESIKVVCARDLENMKLSEEKLVKQIEDLEAKQSANRVCSDELKRENHLLRLALAEKEKVLSEKDESIRAYQANLINNSFEPINDDRELIREIEALSIVLRRSIHKDILNKNFQINDIKSKNLSNIYELYKELVCVAKEEIAEKSKISERQYEEIVRLFKNFENDLNDNYTNLNKKTSGITEIDLLYDYHLSKVREIISKSNYEIKEMENSLSPIRFFMGNIVKYLKDKKDKNVMRFTNDNLEYYENKGLKENLELIQTFLQELDEFLVEKGGLRR